MGKKNKDEETGEYEFQVPDFDEDAFIHKELSSFRTTLIQIPWAAITALVAWLAYTSIGGGRSGWYLGLLIAVAFGFALKFIFPKFGADISHYGRREWLGVGFVFFFAFLSVFLILVNPPVSDLASPQVDMVVMPPVQTTGGDLVVEAFARDNGKLASVELAITRNGEPSFTEVAPIVNAHGRYTLELTSIPAGTYTVNATAKDSKGNTVETGTRFTVGARPMAVNIPVDGNLDSTSDVVEVVFPDSIPMCRNAKTGGWTNSPCVRVVVLALEDGKRIPLAGKGTTWTANIELNGWTFGAQNNFTVEAIMGTQFVGKQEIQGDTVSMGPYSLNVAEGVLPDGFEAKTNTVRGDLLAPPLRQVPGVGAALAIVGLLGIAIVARSKQN